LVLKWELAGIGFVFLAGALLHFVFEWSGESRAVALFASVNESVWEHFKQGYFPMVVFAVVEAILLRGRAKNLLPAKALAVYVLPLITGLAFYGYTAVVGEEILLVDILIFFVAIGIVQMVSYKLLTTKSTPRIVSAAAFVLIVALAVVLMVTTFYPPNLPIFMDGTGFYGIP